MWFRSKYTLLSKSMKMNVYVVSVLVCSIASRSAYRFALIVFGHIGRFFLFFFNLCVLVEVR